MLYITTRNNKDAYTAHRTLHNDFPSEGGLFAPFKLPVFTDDEVRRITEWNFGQIVSEILNIFFATKLTGWDVDISIGRSPVKMVSLSQKIIVSEIWHNPASNFEYAVKNLYKKITEDQGLRPSVWFETAVRIAFLFGVFGELQRVNPETTLDVSVNSLDGIMVNAAFFAKKMGLPIDMLILACEEGSAVWNVLRRGVCASAVSDEETRTVEQVVYHCFGAEDMDKYLLSKQKGGSFTVSDEQLNAVKKYTFAAAVSHSRLESVINSVMRTDSYQINDSAAAAFGAVQDYRASTRENKTTLVFVETSPNQS